MTIRDIFLEELRKKGVKVGTELSAVVPQGRRAPDAVLSNGGDYVLETKLGGEAEHYKDVLKLTEWIKQKHIPILGAFAVLLPGELRGKAWDQEQINQLTRSAKLTWEVTALFRDDRPGDRKRGSLSEVTSWVATQVLKPLIGAEPDLDFIIKVLNGAVDDLKTGMRRLDPKDLQDIFGGKSVFENILELSEGRYPINEMRSAASYLLINQLIFYNVLSRLDSGTYPRIDPDDLTNPSDLRVFFARVLKVDYAPTFGFDIASRIPNESLDTVKGVISVVQAMGLERVKQDVLGKIFHNLIPLEIRKPVAAYYTNSMAGELLAKMSVKKSDDHIIDLACGSGTLLISAYREKRRILERSGREFTQRDHARFAGEEITGVDIMPFAAHLAVVHLSLQAPQFMTQKVRIAVWDSTNLKPGDIIPPIMQELTAAFKKPTLDMFHDGMDMTRYPKYIRKGSLTPDGFGGGKIELAKTEVVIMNPPFTSCDNLRSDYKELLRERFKKQSQFIRGKVNFQGYFMLLADKFLKNRGRAAFVLPQTTFTAEAFQNIIQAFVTEYSVVAVVTGLGRSAFSENTSLSEVLFVAEKKVPQNEHKFALVGTKTSPTEWDAALVSSISDSIDDRRDCSDDRFILRMVPQADLSISKGGLTRLLPRLMPGHDALSARIQPFLESDRLIPYGKLEESRGIFASVSELANKQVAGPEGRGGVYFGTQALNISRDEESALKMVDRLILVSQNNKAMTVHDRVDGQKYVVPLESTLPSIRRLSYCSTMDASRSTDFIISKHTPQLESIMDNIYGKSRGKAFLVRVKEKWPSVVQEGSASLHLARRINLSAIGTIHLAVFTDRPSFLGHGGWGIHCEKDDAKLLCLWFNSSLFLFELLSERTQTEGAWWRIDKGRLARTRVPDLSKLSGKEKTDLIALFDELSKVDFPSILNQLKNSFQGRLRIDEKWLRILGCPAVDATQVASELHTFLHYSLESLKTSMNKG